MPIIDGIPIYQNIISEPVETILVLTALDASSIKEGVQIYCKESGFIYTYLINSGATVDGYNVIKPTVGAGLWCRAPYEAQSYANEVIVSPNAQSNGKTLFDNFQSAIDYCYSRARVS